MIVVQSTTRQVSQSPQRKGVAMLLVLISLMTATVLTAAYLASRDNSAVIGENVSHAASARWGAASGVDMARAILQTDSDWRVVHANGALVTDFPLTSSTLNLSVQDIETSAPPGAETTYVQMLATAFTNDLEHDASAVMIVPVTHVANVDLAEFTAFAMEDIRLSGRSQITRWPHSPLTKLGLPLFIGVKSTSSGSVRFASNTLAIDTTVWMPPGSNSNGISNSSDLEVNALFMHDDIAFPAAPDPPDADVWVDVSPMPLTGGTYRIDVNLRHDALEVIGPVTVNFDGGMIKTEDDLRIRNGGQLRVNGDAVIIVHGELEIDATSSIELGPSGSLRMFVGGDVNIDGYLGERNGQASGPNSDGLGYANVTRIHLMSIESSDVLDWRIKGDALVKAVIYAPHASVRLSNNARVCGRLAVGELQLSNNAVIYYDHALDRQTGYTNAYSLIYDDDGRVRSSFGSLESLNDEDLASLASSLSIRIDAVGESHGERQDPPPNDLMSATPRRVRVTTNAVLTDSSVAIWEQ